MYLIHIIINQNDSNLLAEKVIIQLVKSIKNISVSQMQY